MLYLGVQLTQENYEAELSAIKTKTNRLWKDNWSISDIKLRDYRKGQADHRAFGNIRTILKTLKNQDEIRDATDILTLVSIKIQDEIWDTHLFKHSNATCLYFL